MPLWKHPDRGYNTSAQWTEQVAPPARTEKVVGEKTSLPHSARRTPTPGASTSVLPPPGIQKSPGSFLSGRRNKKKSARIGLTVHWAKFKRRIGTGTAPSSSSFIEESAAESSFTRRLEGEKGGPDENGEVDEVVVDRAWSEEFKSSITHSEHGVSPEKSGGSYQFGTGNSDHESVVPTGWWSIWMPLIILRWRVWPAILEFFSTRFIDDKSEQHYAQVCLVAVVPSIYSYQSSIHPAGKLVHKEVTCALGFPLDHLKLDPRLYLRSAIYLQV